MNLIIDCVVQMMYTLILLVSSFYLKKKKMADSDVINLHKAFDFIFKPNHQLYLDQSDLNLLNGENLNNKKSVRLNEISIDLHVSAQMILLYPDIDSENIIKEIVTSFSKIASKLSK
jgi:hypothetical protein